MDFVERHVLVMSLLVLLGGVGAVAGFVGSGSSRTTAAAAGSAALACAIACVGVGWFQEEALLRAWAEVKAMPGLSHADRERIAWTQLADARTALEAGIALAIAPLGAGGLALLQALRRRS